ncbi:hypothetical protein NDU88_004129 [Pleurodeles waltl]|uniref:Uncharacterized protein n=1 Tax=Pleurodeles waltl TaxID=8319 RepID=A0AAV7NMK2_PLEWA|nr:hypothetical protein NDU88_004129 [Pleurodeles waltl]
MREGLYRAPPSADFFAPFLGPKAALRPPPGWGAARTSGVDDTDWRKRGESQTQISAQGTAGADGRVEIQQDGTMAVVMPEMTDESTEPSDVRMESVSVDT